MHLRISYSKIHARTHANRPGTFARRRERQGPLDVFQEAPRTSSPSIAYNMRHYDMNTRMPRVHTQVCTSAAHLRSNRPLLHPTRWWNVLRTRPRLNANTLNLTKIRWHSANRLKLFEESIRKARFEGFAFVASLLEKKGGDEGGEAFENLESTQQWLFVRLTRPSLETIPREPYTSFLRPLHPPRAERDRASERQTACPGVSLCIRHA